MGRCRIPNLRLAQWFCPLATWIAVSSMAIGLVADEDKSAWTKPRQLIHQLEAMGENPLTETWSRTTLQLISFIGESNQSSRQRLISLQQLAKQRDQISTILADLQKSQSATNPQHEVYNDLVRMHYRLSRRIAVWDAVLRLPVQDSVGDSGPMLRNASYGKIDFSQLPRGWVEFLRLNEFHEAFGTLNPDREQQRETARRILARIYAPTLTAKQSDFVLSAIDDEVLNFLKDHASEPVDPADLIHQLEYYEARPSNRSSHKLNQRYQDLYWSTDPRYQRVAQALDAHYRNANFRLAISQEFMNRLLPELPTIAEPVSDTIQGARVSGSSQISNQLQVNLIPDPKRLNLQIQTDGQVHSDTVARTKGFRILNQGLAQFQVYKQITVDANGIDGSSRAYATSTANQLLVGVQSKLDHLPVLGNLARKVAEKKVREQAPETNQLLRRKVARSAEQRVEEIFDKQIAKVEQNASKHLLQPLMALDLDPEPIQLATTTNQVVMRYRLAGRDQMAANTARPLDNQQSLLSFQLHQSLINNSIARLELQGRTFDSDSLAKHLQEKLGLKQQALMDNGDAPRDAEFTFDSYDPIRISFETDRILITLKFKELKVNDRKSVKRAQMTAAYSVTTDGLKVRLRQDESRKVLGGRGAGEKFIISTALNLLFDEQYEFNGLPAQFREYPQAQSLMVSQLVIDDGWIGVSLDDPYSLRVQAGQVPEPQRIGGNIRKLFERR